MFAIITDNKVQAITKSRMAAKKEGYPVSDTFKIDENLTQKQLAQVLSFTSDKEVKRISSKPRALELILGKAKSKIVKKPRALPKVSHGDAPAGYPREGTACRQIWDIADSMKDAKRKDVVDACVDQGLALGTSKTQYQKWFAYHANN